MFQYNYLANQNLLERRVFAQRVTYSYAFDYKTYFAKFQEMFQLDFKVQHPTVPARNCRLNSQITRSTRSEITAAMTFEVWKHTQYPTADDYNAICKLLAEKHSALINRI